MFGSLIVAYLFVGGMGAGAAVSIGVLGVFETVCRPSLPERSAHEACFAEGRPAFFCCSFFFHAAAVAGISLFAGIVCLLLDVGRADRVLLLFQPRPTFLVFGAYALAACLALLLAACFFWGASGRRRPRFIAVLLHALLSVSGAAVVLYTSFLLASIPAVPLWNSVWLTVLFALSSCSCGLALVMAVLHATAAAFGTTDYLRRAVRALSVVDLAFVLCEIVACALLVLAGLDVPAVAPDATSASLTASVETLLFGEHAWVFWFLFVVVGMLAPLLLDALVSAFPSIPTLGLAACGCILVGGAALRWCMVEAAMHPLVATTVTPLFW